MQLLRLTPEQVMTYWEGIKAAIWEALPPITYEGDDTILAIQEKFLLGNMQCWAAIEKPSSPIIYGFAATQIIYDELSRKRSLLLFAVCVINEHPKSMWTDAYESMKRYARENKCEKIIAYSNKNEVFHLSEKLGADISWRLIQFIV